MTETVTVRRLPAAEGPARVEELAILLRDCVDGGASVGFLSPLSRTRALEFWNGVIASLGRGERIVLIAELDGRLVGTVQLITALPDNQPHRADVAKMLVSPGARRRGIAQGLMAALEQIAREEGRRVLVLDTVTGSDASRVYARAGWIRVGEIPDYALMPDRALCATTYYYKHL